ncbi:MAG TPA: diaminopimelate decarboxylase [Terriglobales bacterium]|nr:diaminopimelate decarboxylase [Terriglobales bacterium]
MPSSSEDVFHMRKGRLHCEQVDLTRAAQRFGTPLYVYSATLLSERLKIFSGAFASLPHTVCYSVKANPNLSLLRMLARAGAGFDVVSGGELLRVETGDKKALARVVFSGVGKTAEEIELALRKRILLFNMESEQELDAVARAAAKRRTKAHVAFRVNPDVNADTHPYISTGLHEHKFGVPIADALALYRRAAKTKGLQPAGVSVHIGSQINDFSAFAEAMTRVAELVRQLRAADIEIRYVDAGGGLGIDYQQDESLSAFATRAQSYARAIATPLNGLNVHLILEPGRSLVARAGALLTRVLYTKRNGKKRFAVVDAAMNDLMRPALYQAFHRIQAVASAAGAEMPYDVVGPVCESGDFLGRDRALPELEQGDLLAVRDVGAYGMSLSSNYNSRPRAVEVLVRGSKMTVIRKRETIKDLLRQES